MLGGMNDPNPRAPTPLAARATVAVTVLLLGLALGGCETYQRDRRSDTAAEAEPAPGWGVKTTADGKRVRCLKTCKRWEERCDNYPGAGGGGGQSCRRVCSEFGEECYEL